MDTIESGARIARAILREWIGEEALNACESFSATHDLCDANIALYGAFAAIYFREIDCANEAEVEWCNKVADKVFT